MRGLHVVFSLLAACAGSGAPAGTDANSGSDTGVPDTAPPNTQRLEVRSLGVQGFVLSYGSDTIMTAPLFTRQSAIDVALNVPLPPDIAAIDQGLAGVAFDQLRAVVSGHAHYDHFLDVPHVLELAPGARAYTNLSGRNILAALAPDRPAGCTNAPQRPLARDRVIALDDALASHVDYTNCPSQRPAGAPMTGSWLAIPNSHARIMAFCSMHPAQVGPFHFGEGSVDTEQCELPPPASKWLEGQTLALLVDFLDERGAPQFRVFYQDAPTNAPIGLIPPAILAERRVDVGLMCVGSNDAVENEPTAILENIQPRFAFAGHWEDFFQKLGGTPQPIPFLNIDEYTERATAALPGPADAPLLVDGIESTDRQVLVQPGSRLSVPPPPRAMPRY